MNREAVRQCPACGDHAAHEVTLLECNSCGSAMYSNWKVAPTSPIAELLAQYADEHSDFSGQKGYEFALMLARQYAERGPDSQMRCVVHTLLARLDAPRPEPTAWVHSHGGLVYHCQGAVNEAMRTHGWTPLYKET